MVSGFWGLQDDERRDVNEPPYQYMFPIVEDARPENERKRKAATRAFWFFWVPSGAFIAGIISLISGYPGLFLPVWGIITIVAGSMNDN